MFLFFILSGSVMGIFSLNLLTAFPSKFWDMLKSLCCIKGRLRPGHRQVRSERQEGWACREKHIYVNKLVPLGKWKLQIRVCLFDRFLVFEKQNESTERWKISNWNLYSHPCYYWQYWKFILGKKVTDFPKVLGWNHWYTSVRRDRQILTSGKGRSKSDY